ncbi:hypothetical protein AB0K16_22020 [Nonomuraea jabiensis]|uniref:hypothetical protein n=1 Tax=Nonomuraea jabiensis TaxID=882448 RepID=UPI0034146582
MHSTDTGSYTFHHNGDFSGDVLVNVGHVEVATTLPALARAYHAQDDAEVHIKATVTSRCQHAGKSINVALHRVDVERLLARYVRAEFISTIENMSDASLLLHGFALNALSDLRDRD